MLHAYLLYYVFHTHSPAFEKASWKPGHSRAALTRECTTLPFDTAAGFCHWSILDY